MHQDYTVDQLIEERRTVTAICRSCREEAWLDLEQARQHFGGGMWLNRIALRIICEDCGSGDCNVVVSPPKGS